MPGVSQGEKGPVEGIVHSAQHRELPHSNCTTCYMSCLSTSYIMNLPIPSAGTACSTFVHEMDGWWVQPTTYLNLSQSQSQISINNQQSINQ